MRKSATISILVSAAIVCAPPLIAEDAQKAVPAEPVLSQTLSHGPVTPLDVIEMTRSGLSDSVIISAIDATDAEYSLTVADMINLKKSGVSDNVINYMINKKPVPVAKKVEQSAETVPATVTAPPQVTYVVQDTPAVVYDYSPPVSIGFSWGWGGPYWGSYWGRPYRGWGYRRFPRRGWRCR